MAPTTARPLRPSRCPLAVFAAVAALLASLAGCGSDTVDQTSVSSASSPFTVGPVPEGYELVVAGRGTARQGWGEDCCGTEEPFTGRRDCTTGALGSGDDVVAYRNNPPDRPTGLPPFVVVVTTQPATRVRVRTPSDTAEADLHPVPGSDRKGAVVFVDRPGLPGCNDRVPPEGLDVMRVELLDADGRVVDCRGVD